jgi:hypothetical protein
MLFCAEKIYFKKTKTFGVAKDGVDFAKWNFNITLIGKCLHFFINL